VDLELESRESIIKYSKSNIFPFRLTDEKLKTGEGRGAEAGGTIQQRHNATFPTSSARQTTSTPASQTHTRTRLHRTLPTVRSGGSWTGLYSNLSLDCFFTSGCRRTRSDIRREALRRQPPPGRDPDAVVSAEREGGAGEV
jgi:hypothetical protein